MPRAPGLIIDTDPGVDDAIAILLALASTSANLLGLTVVGGNVPLARGTRNALAILDWVHHSEIPVCRGSSRPLKGRFGYSFAFHGKSGITHRLPNPQTRPSTEGAAEFMARNLQKLPGGVSLVALGPLTNMARMLGSAPAARGNPLASAASLTIMGGAVNCPGNVTAYAEFNFYSDPLAAHQVLNCGIPITLVDLAACRQVALTRDQVVDLGADTLWGNLAIEILKGWFKQDPNRDSFQFYDPLALAVALDPRLVATRPVSLEVLSDESPLRGHSRISAEPRNIELVTEVDRGRFFTLLADLMGWKGLAPGVG
ncbi:MAG: hypothetical protein BZY88_06655 [SAR202 cluster bacterium Io17-Chloro-G9]|nr:MAG: hypothetical protein BZY88_06655 [SAR202 cluster bacterium Io17-Chloro-G9]